jgi:pyruvate/2-oxoglutarate dehydrogenase complex dihydrolipoamide dehydrogenase (E3) component
VRSGIDIQLNGEATLEKIEALRPDAVILATGSRPAVPDIPGLDDPIMCEELLTGAREAGDRVLVLGGGMVGVETAEFLAKKGRQVAVVEILEEVARDMDPISHKMLSKRLESLPVELYTSTRLLSLEDGQAIGETGGKERNLGRFDSIVVAIGHVPFDPLSKELIAAGFAVAVVGDAEKPGKAYDAVNSGHRAAAAV